MKKLTLALALTISIWASTANSSEQKTAAATLTNTHWQLVELMGKPISGLPKMPNITLNENEKRYHGTGGCNHIGGSYELSDLNGIRFTEGMSTMMACMGGGMEVEQQFMDMLGRVDNYIINGQILQLNRAKMAPLAKFEAVYLQ